MSMDSLFRQLRWILPPDELSEWWMGSQKRDAEETMRARAAELRAKGDEPPKGMVKLLRLDEQDYLCAGREINRSCEKTIAPGGECHLTREQQVLCPTCHTDKGRQTIKEWEQQLGKEEAAASMLDRLEMQVFGEVVTGKNKTE